MRSFLDSENRKYYYIVVSDKNVTSKDRTRVNRCGSRRIWMRFASSARVSSAHSIYEPCTRAARVRTRRPSRHGMWSGSLECARAAADASGEAGGGREGGHRCACYSSRFLSPRNALAIIAART